MRRATVIVVAAAVALGMVALLVGPRPRSGPNDGAAPVASLQELLGTWEAVEAERAPAPLVAPVALQFVEGGVFVQTGCNTGRGPAHVESGRLVVEALATTKKACVPPLDTQEEWVLAMLASAPRLERSGAALALYWGEGDPYRLGLEQVPEGEPSPATTA